MELCIGHPAVYTSTFTYANSDGSGQFDINVDPSIFDIINVLEKYATKYCNDMYH